MLPIWTAEQIVNILINNGIESAETRAKILASIERVFEQKDSLDTSVTVFRWASLQEDEGRDEYIGKFSNKEAAEKYLDSLGVNKPGAYFSRKSFYFMEDELG